MSSDRINSAVIGISPLVNPFCNLFCWFSITAEHLKYGRNKLLNLLVKIVNFSFENLSIAPCLKSGVACPIRKKGKPKQDPNLYRKITRRCPEIPPENLKS
jgi:hypothetical protein